MAASQDQRTKLPGLALAGVSLLIGVHLFMRVNMGWGLIWNWDEFHLIATAGRYANDPSLHQGRPPGAYLLLRPLLEGATSTAGLHWAGRSIAALVSLATLALVLLLARVLGGRTAVLLCLPALVLEPTWLERSSELRSGTLAGLPAVAAVLCWAVGGKKPWLAGAGTALLAGLALFLSPKALYPLAVGGVLVAAPSWGAPPGKLTTGGAALVLGGILFAGTLFLLPDQGMGLGDWIAHWAGELRVPDYAGWAGDRYVAQSCTRAPWLVWLPCVGIAAGALAGGVGGAIRAALPLALTLFILAVHSARFPYFLAQLTPLWVLASCVPLATAMHGHQVRRGALLSGLLLLGYSIFAASPWLLRLFPQTNDHQLDTMEVADRLPSDTPYFDPHDMMARHPNPVGNLFSTSIASLEAGERGGWPSFRIHLRSSAPAFWIKSRRTDALDATIRQDLERRYAHLDANVYVARAAANGNGRHTLEVPSSGTYIVHRLVGRATLEGAPLVAGQELQLEARDHLVELSGTEPEIEVRWGIRGGWPDTRKAVARVSRRYHE